MEKAVFEFENALDTGLPIAENIGRFMVGGKTVRLLFTPKGLVMVMPESLKTDGHIWWFQDEDDPALKIPKVDGA